MKTHAIIITAILATTFGLGAEQTQAETETRVITSETLGSELSRTYMITVKETMGASEPIDVIFGGSSSEMRAQLMNPSRSIEVSLEEGDDGTMVSYSIAVKVGDNPATSQSTVVTGSFLATVGEPMSVLEVGESALTIQIDHAIQKTTSTKRKFKLLRRRVTEPGD